MPGSGHRYFPVNLSVYYIYVNLFWAYFKETSGSWHSEAEEAIHDVAPGSDRAALQRLAEADMQPADQVHSGMSGTPRQQPQQQANSDIFEDMFHFIEEMDDDPEVINDGLAEAAADGMFRMRKNAGFPSSSTFVRARYDAQFRDVKKREKHFHCRCATCSDLSTKIRPRVTPSKQTTSSSSRHITLK